MKIVERIVVLDKNKIKTCKGMRLGSSQRGNGEDEDEQIITLTYSSVYKFNPLFSFGKRRGIIASQYLIARLYPQFSFGISCLACELHRPSSCV